MGDQDLAKAVSETILLQHLDGEAQGKRPEQDAGRVDKNRIDERLVVYHRPRSIEAEYFRFLKSRIEHHFEDLKDGKSSRVIVVTGPSLGAGKTSCSLNLALAFARSYGSQTLFMDADSRKGMSAKYLGIQEENLPGFADVLTMRARAGSVLLNTGMFDMAYFPAGQFSEGFLDHLRGQDLGILIRSLRNRFKFVIIDAPPAFPMPEPAILAQHADGVFIVLRAGRDGQDDLIQAQEALEGAPILGIILNGVKKTPGQRYGAYGYYGKSTRAKGG